MRCCRQWRQLLLCFWRLPPLGGCEAAWIANNPGALDTCERIFHRHIPGSFQPIQATRAAAAAAAATARVSVEQAGVPTAANGTRTVAAAAGAAVQGVKPCAWAVSSRAVHEHGLSRGSARSRSMWLKLTIFKTWASLLPGGLLAAVTAGWTSALCSCVLAAWGAFSLGTWGTAWLS
jgi:hypothetical protein